MAIGHADCQHITKTSPDPPTGGRTMHFHSIGSLLSDNGFKRLMPAHHRRRLTAGVLALGCYLVFSPRPLIGESYQTDAVKEHQLSKIRTAIELQQTGMSTASRDTLAESIANTSGKYSSIRCSCW